MEKSYTKSFNTSNSPFTYSKEQYLYLVYVADKCQRFEDALNAFEALIQKFQCNLNTSEREIFESCFKNIIKNKQINLNKLNTYINKVKKQIEENADDQSQNNFLSSLEEEKVNIENTVKNVCKKILRLIDNFLLKNIAYFANLDKTETFSGNPLGNNLDLLESDKEAEMFFLRLKGDLYKYLSQVEVKEEYENLLNSANQFFKEAVITGTKNFSISNKTYLETVIAYSKFLQDFMKEKDSALKLLISIYNSEDCEDILAGNLQADEGIVNCLKSIKTMLES